MSQNDFNVANQGFPSFRSDMNSAFQALASNSSGATAPSTTYAYQWWYDTANDILKMRNADNDAWIDIAEFDQVADTWQVLGSVDLSAVAEDIIPDADSTRDIGSTSNRWAQGWFDDVTSTNTSDGTLSVPTIYVTNGSAKSWGNLDQTVTLTANDSFNMSSFVDNSTGVGTANFTSAMDNAFYSVSGMSTNSLIVQTATLNTGSFQYVVRNAIATGVVDTGRICISIDGDLA